MIGTRGCGAVRWWGGTGYERMAAVGRVGL